MAVLVLGACRGQPESNSSVRQTTPAPSPAIERPVIELGGCRHVEAGTCTLVSGDTGQLRVWIDVQRRAALMVEIDGAPIDPERAAVDGGQRLRIAVPESAKLLRITGVDPPWTEPFELRIARELEPPVVAEAHAMVDAGRILEAVELLRGALGQLDGTERLAASQMLWRLLVTFDPVAGLDQVEQAAELARALGRDRDLADCAAGASFLALLFGDLARARRWTQELEGVAATQPEARVWARYYGGMLASRTGDLSDSVRALEEAGRLGLHLEMSSALLSIHEQRATVLAELGRAEEALLAAREIQERVTAPGVACNDRARALGNVAWINLLLAAAGHPHDPPRPLLEQQLAAVSATGPCPDSSNPALVNLALVALAEHEPEEAWEWLLAQQAAGVPAYLRLWVDEIAAQIGVATGRDALVPALVVRPDPGGGEPGLRWMAIVRHAQTLDALGFGDAAIASYLEAEAVLEETFLSVGVDLGRELFLAGRRASAEGLIELLVRRGDVDAAFCRARLARGRALRTVDRAARIAGLSSEQRARRSELLFGFLAMQDTLAAERREDWKFSAPEREHRERRREQRVAKARALLDEALRLTGGRDKPADCDDLPALDPGEVTILQFPRAKGGSWIFVADAEGASERAVADVGDASRWTADLLEPLANRLSAAESIRIMPTGAGWSVPFHALPFADGVLLDLAPVVYALDLPARPQRGAAIGKAVVVANPSEDLPHAAEEASEVERRLASMGWTVGRLTAAEATRARLSESLADAGLLHYAGHGRYEGVDGWGAALLLHDGDQLAVSDILALPRVPAAVVLSGCDTATVDRETVAGGMNLGRAFVLAGASWVIAAEGEVDDELARAVGVALYDESVPPGMFDGPAALRRAQLRLRAEHPDRWHAFRVVVP